MSMLKCCGCGKKDLVPPGRLQPKGWLTWSNPLFGREWEATGCSWKCLNTARWEAITHARRAAETAPS